MKPNKLFNILVITFYSLLLSACSNDNSDLIQYINKIKAKPPMKIEPIPQVTALPVFKFPEKAKKRNPFEPIEQKKRTDLLAPDHKRPKQPLEAFSLDSLRFVGTLKEEHQIWALIRQPDGQVQRIRIGQYMGKNFGRIMLIKDEQVKLEETIEDLGTWKKHIAVINLYTGFDR